MAALARGRVCERWRSFGTFYRDVGKRPSWRHLLFRIDQSGEFSPSNARWQIAKCSAGGWLCLERPDL
jgi:hypothetical protein